MFSKCNSMGPHSPSFETDFPSLFNVRFRSSVKATATKQKFSMHSSNETHETHVNHRMSFKMNEFETHFFCARFEWNVFAPFEHRKRRCKWESDENRFILNTLKVKFNAPEIIASSFIHCRKWNVFYAMPFNCVSSFCRRDKAKLSRIFLRLCTSWLIANTKWLISREFQCLASNFDKFQHVNIIIFFPYSLCCCCCFRENFFPLFRLKSFGNSVIDFERIRRLCRFRGR